MGRGKNAKRGPSRRVSRRLRQERAAGVTTWNGEDRRLENMLGVIEREFAGGARELERDTGEDRVML